MPDQPQQSSGFGGILKSKWGPLPVWGWLLVVTVLAVGYYLWTRRQGAGQTTAPMSGQPGVVVINQGGDMDTGTTPPKPAEDHDKDKDDKTGGDKDGGGHDDDDHHRHRKRHRDDDDRRRRASMPPTGHAPGPAPGPVPAPSPAPMPRLGIPKRANIGLLFPKVTPVYGPAGGQAGGRAGQGPV